jgi:hypothetical protein
MACGISSLVISTVLQKSTALPEGIWSLTNNPVNGSQHVTKSGSGRGMLAGFGSLNRIAAQTGFRNAVSRIAVPARLGGAKHLVSSCANCIILGATLASIMSIDRCHDPPYAAKGSTLQKALRDCGTRLCFVDIWESSVNSEHTCGSGRLSNEMSAVNTCLLEVLWTIRSAIARPTS